MLCADEVTDKLLTSMVLLNKAQTLHVVTETLENHFISWGWTFFCFVSCIINSVIKSSLIQKHIRLKIYDILPRPILVYGCDTQTLRKTDEARIIVVEMRCMRHTVSYTKWDRRRNVVVVKELKIELVFSYIDGTQ